MTKHDVSDRGADDAREELGRALEELKAGLDEVLSAARQRLDEADHRPVEEGSELTPDAGGALWELLRSLPGVIGNSLSGEEARVVRARETLGRLDARLDAAGVDLGDGLVGYADRLASLRGEATHDR